MQHTVLHADMLHIYISVYSQQKMAILTGRRPLLKTVGVHARSDTHVKAMIAWSQFKRMAKNNTTVLGMMRDENQKGEI